MKKILFFATTLIVLASCRDNKYGTFTISGKIDHTVAHKIMLEELPFDGRNPVVIDTAAIKPNGTFELHGLGREEGLYRVVVGTEGPYVLLVNDSKDIKLQLDVNNYRDYKTEGSPASESLHHFFEDYSTKDSVLDRAFGQIDTLQKQNSSDSLVNIARSQRDKAVKDINSLVSGFINGSPSPAARYYVLGMAQRYMSVEEVQALVNASYEKFKEHSGIARIKSILSTQKAAPPKNPLLGQQAPEINLPDADGKPFALSSLKGKYVLVDFWASWCAPCRRENPNVVAAYNSFKDKNFTILGVSLDDDKANWLEAVKADKLDWKHISDLKQWSSAVVPLYHIEGIPFNVLVDPQGKIIATELRGDDLHKKLAEVLK